MSKNHISQRQRFKTAVAAVAVPFLILTGAPAAHAVFESGSSSIVASSDDWKFVPKKESTTCKDLSSSSSQGSSSTDGAPATGVVQDAFMTEGTPEHEVAQEIFDYFVKDKGTSGAFAAGVLANVKQESGFVPDRAEGVGVLRFGMDTKSPPAGMSGGGGGLFQFTPYTKYTDTKFWGKDGKDGWTIRNQLDFLWSAEFENSMVMSFIRSPNPVYGL